MGKVRYMEPATIDKLEEARSTADPYPDLDRDAISRRAAEFANCISDSEALGRALGEPVFAVYQAH